MQSAFGCATGDARIQGEEHPRGYMVQLPAHPGPRRGSHAPRAQDSSSPPIPAHPGARTSPRLDRACTRANRRSDPMHGYMHGTRCTPAARGVSVARVHAPIRGPRDLPRATPQQEPQRASRGGSPQGAARTTRLARRRSPAADASPARSMLPSAWCRARRALGQ